MTTSRMAVNLSNFYGIDRILFGRNNPKDVLSEDDFKGYTTAKGALLANVYDIYKKIGYETSKKFTDAKGLVEYGIDRADKSIQRANAIIESDLVSNAIKNDLQKIVESKEDVDEKEVAKNLVVESVQKIALDSFLLEGPVANSCPLCLEDWKGKILIDAHKSLRDSLIRYTK